jgi:hypothetical protein
METSKKQNQMNTFLKLKHWQLFGVLAGIPAVFQFVATGWVVANTDLMKFLWQLPFNPARWQDIVALIPIKLVAGYYAVMMVLFAALIFCWLYSLGTNLCKRLPEAIKMNLTGFKLSLFIAVACKVFSAAYMYFLFGGISAGGEWHAATFAVLVPLQLMSMFCTFYCFYFIAKALKTIELQQAVTFNDCALEFFGIWIFPVGIWFVQPKINKIFNC